MAAGDSKTCTRCGETKPLDEFSPSGPGKRRSDCKTCHAALRRRRYHADLPAARKANRDARRKAYALDPETYKARSQAWRDANRAQWLEAGVNARRRHRARLKGVEVVIYTRREIYDRDGGCCKMCGIRLVYEKHGFEIDHIVPLALGGADTRANVQLACRPCNRSKWANLEGQIHLPV